MHTTNCQLIKLSQSQRKLTSTLEDSTKIIRALILDNQELAVKMAFSMLSKWRFQLPKPEVHSIAALALCEAANRFDHNRGVSFGTFLFSYVRGHLLKEITASYNRKKRFVLVEDQTDTDKQQHTDFDERLSPERIALTSQLLKRLFEAKKKLTTLEKKILDHCFADEMTVVDIAKTLGYSRGHVSRMKSDALELLCESFEMQAAA